METDKSIVELMQMQISCAAIENSNQSRFNDSTEQVLPDWRQSGGE
jgi:hypothetical protein